MHPSFSFMQRNNKNEIFSYQRDDVMVTKIMNPHVDHVYYLMKDLNNLGIARSNYLAASSDWLCFVTVTISEFY